MSYLGGYLGGGGGSSDSDAPTITIVSPTPGVAPGQPGGFPRNRQEALVTPIVLRVSDAAPGIAYIEVAVRFYGSQEELDADENGVEETIYRRGNFRGKHTSSSVEVDGTDLILTVFRAGGWTGRFIKFSVDSLDSDGNLTA